jgi:hypothetical protein
MGRDVCLAVERKTCGCVLGRRNLSDGVDSRFSVTIVVWGVHSCLLLGDAGRQAGMYYRIGKNKIVVRCNLQDEQMVGACIIRFGSLTA